MSESNQLNEKPKTPFIQRRGSVCGNYVSKQHIHMKQYIPDSSFHRLMRLYNKETPKYLYMSGHIRNRLDDDNMNKFPNIADTHRIFLRMSRKKETLSIKHRDLQASYRRK
ncbi:hypothetical protein C922_04689 [Plasmodium inui San Antonio 1]|uniref:Uncharacterized protein n=1 Tax=Plasmodium inui San Antonio 1 TaxID=1237626 RepID=W6ZVZ2_9APIC|nr:hypothetical protein C922_04689 [Plasmodium inui San Antonio 1]EUD64957.1 hypothetical protein C922_04689 [Plasmodium inui San Antonio 1]